MAFEMDDITEVKARMINLYEKLSDVSITREYLKNEMQTAEITGISRALHAGKTYGKPYGNCRCNKTGKKVPSGIYVQNIKGTKSVNCFDCMKQYISRDRIELDNDKVDYLGWGLSGLFEQMTSEESSESTSSDEDVSFERRCMYSRQKILRKLRRKQPQVFLVNYAKMSMEEILKMEIDDPEMLRSVKKARGIDSKNEKQVQISKPQVRQKLNYHKDYDLYGGGHFDFSYEVHLRDKYSSTKFDFLTGLIHYYQKFLRKHPEERYPSVSELMIKSGQSICKVEEDVVAQYYDVLYKKGRVKPTETTSLKIYNEDSEVRDMQVTKSQQDKPSRVRMKDVIPIDEIVRAKRTGVLDLSSKSLVEIPKVVWYIDREPVESKRDAINRLSNPEPIKRMKLNKPMIYLNLSNNKLGQFNPVGNCFESLIHLCLSNNKVEELPEEIGKFKNLELLDLENNSLKSLPKSLANLSSLKELNLRRNYLKELPNNLGALKKLKSIDLRWNKLIKLPDTVEDLEELRNLNASNNKISALPMDLCNMYSLIILDVSYNKIREMPTLGDMPKLLLVNAMGNLIKDFPNFSNSKSLCEIRLDGNRIKSIVTSYMTDSPVVQLTLSHNKIEEIPEDLYHIETIVLLDLTYNRLSRLPESLARLKYLTCLRVEENPITNIKKDVLEGGSKRILGELVRKLFIYEGDNKVICDAKKELETLYVRGVTSAVIPVNRTLKIDPKEVAKTRSLVRKRLELTTLPSEWIKIAEQYKVTLVDISKNKFRYLPAGLKTLSLTLKELIVRENNIKTLPDFIGRMPQLAVLDLSFNHFDNLPLSMTTCHLTKLMCRRNMFTSIPKVVFMIQTIEYLDLSENMIKEIDADGLRNLRKLYHLNLSKNEIRKLPTELGYLVNIRQLDVNDNLFRRPGPHILRGGTQVIMEYLKRH